MSNGTSVKNIKIQGGHIGINVEEKAGVKIENCKITDTEKIGINIENGKKKNIVLVKNCEIYENSGKGVYVQKNRRVRISKNKVYKNDEEGIDLRSSLRGSISKNKAYDNEESGIELAVGKSKLKIRNNKLNGNDSSGITNQFYKDSKKEGKIIIEENKITKNKNYGVKCSTPSGSGGKKSESYWLNSLIFNQNIFAENDNGPIKNTCLRP